MHNIHTFPKYFQEIYVNSRIVTKLRRLHLYIRNVIYRTNKQRGRVVQGSTVDIGTSGVRFPLLPYNFENKYRLIIHYVPGIHFASGK